MSLVDPQVIRSERHTEIGNLLLSGVGIVIDRWSRRATQEQPDAKRLHHDVLLDHLTDFLRRLGHSLIESEMPDNSQHCLPAAMHGQQRWDVGWSLPEVIRDYQILRLVVIEYLEESLDRPLGYREVLAISLALDESISASVVAYVKARDEHRSREAEGVQKQLLAHAAELQHADRRKNEFLAILAHELRNPLAPVQHAVQVLKVKNLPEATFEWARGVIERQAQQMAQMIDDLFDISRIAYGKIKLAKEPVVVASVIDRAIEVVSPAMQARKQQLTADVPSEPIWVEADPRRLIQVVVNLLANAAKYTPEAGQIRLNVEREAEQVVLKVRDNGIGIPGEFLPRIFEPFTQEQQGADRSCGGLGIGLALVRNIVELHGGTVAAFSPGRGAGSEFTVRLPVLKEAPTLAQAQELSGSFPRTSRRVLIVDDNRDAAHSLQVLLKLNGHEVQVAHDGPTALEVARKEVPEVILLDIGMPRMDGLEVARFIREDPALKHVFLVALTGYGQDEDQRRFTDAGFDVHLVKPVALDHIISLLHTSEPKSTTDDRSGPGPS